MMIVVRDVRNGDDVIISDIYLLRRQSEPHSEEIRNDYRGPGSDVMYIYFTCHSDNYYQIAILGSEIEYAACHCM